MQDALYTEYDLSPFEKDDIEAFFRWKGSVDAYCRTCERTSVFRIPQYSTPYGKEKQDLPDTGLLKVVAECTRSEETIFRYQHSKLVVLFWREKERLVKVGQYPSKATLDLGSLDPVFDKQLTDDQRAEIGRAVGLRGYNIGVGSFVYVRRVFESLVEEAHKKAKSGEGWNEAEYSSAKMKERVGMLADYLPPRLVNLTHLYAVVSKGIHELNEEDCLENFDTVLSAIRMILLERAQEQEYKKVRDALSKVS